MEKGTLEGNAESGGGNEVKKAVKEGSGILGRRQRVEVARRK